MNKCVICGKPLKKTLLDKNPKADRCYKCWVQTKMPNTQGRREIFQNKKEI